jgi:hypothetical protein
VCCTCCCCCCGHCCCRLNYGAHIIPEWKLLLAGWLGTDRRRHKSSSCIEKKEQKEKRRYEPGAICTLY